MADLLHEAQQPRLAMGAGVTMLKKTRKRTEDAVADRVNNGDSSSARIDNCPTSLTSLGMIAEPLLITPEKCIGDALVNESAKVLKPHLPPVEVRMLPSTTGGLLPAGTVSTAMRTIFLPMSLFTF